jgi:hypothetical protein
MYRTCSAGGMPQAWGFSQDVEIELFMIFGKGIVAGAFRTFWARTPNLASDFLRIFVAGYQSRIP